MDWAVVFGEIVNLYDWGGHGVSGYL
jgi:hypothetical protein